MPWPNCARRISIPTMVTRIDRLARSIGDLQDIVRAVKATEQPIDTGTAAGKCFLDMLGVFAEFETNLRRERQLEGIKGQGSGHLQGPAGFNRGIPGARTEGTGHAPYRHRQGTQDRPGECLQGVGRRFWWINAMMMLEIARRQRSISGGLHKQLGAANGACSVPPAS
jgi:hypothetical protein